MGDITSLLAQIEGQRKVVDAKLTLPASWRGELRRNPPRAHTPEETADYARAFESLLADRRDMNAAWLQQLHLRAIGGGSYRTSRTKIGNYDFPPPAEVIHLTDLLLRDINASSDPAPLVASRLHLRLMLIHPFADGNGRTARLAASALLMCAGFRSTLFTAVEQHFTYSPSRYGESLRELRDGKINEEEWHAGALEAMASRSDLVCTFRIRQAHLRELLNGAGIGGDDQELELIGFDLEDTRSGAKLRALTDEPTWKQIQSGLGPEAIGRLRSQLKRLVSEEDYESMQKAA